MISKTDLEHCNHHFIDDPTHNNIIINPVHFSSHSNIDPAHYNHCIVICIYHVLNWFFFLILPGGGQAAKSYTPGSEIAFVHSDGRVERFRPFNGAGADTRISPSNRKQTDKAAEGSQNSHELRNHRMISHNRPSTSFHQASTDLESVTSLGPDLGDAVSLGGCDIPPSYEEALGMPVAANIGSGIGSEDGDDVAVGGRLEIDYFNTEIPQHEEDIQGENSKRECEDPEVCDSGTALLPSDKCS